MKKIISSALLVSLMPAFVFAQGVTDLPTLINKIDDLVNSAIWLLVSLAVIFIVWNSVQFILKAGDSEARKTYQAAIMWGIVGLFVILSIWGLVNILNNTFGVENQYNQGQATSDMNSLILPRNQP